MSSATYVFQRPSGYFFRFRIPSDLKPLVGKTELRYSLRTGKSTVAKSRAMVIAGRLQCLVRSIRNKKVSNMTKLTRENIDKLVQKYIHDFLEADEESRIMTPEILDDKGYHEFVMEGYEDAVTETKYLLSINDNKYFEDTVDKQILEPYGIEADKDSFEYRKLCREVAKANFKLVEIQRRREVGDYSDEVKDITVKSSNTPEPIVDTGETVSKVMDDFFEEGDAEERWTPKTRKEVRASMQVLIDYFGDVPVNSIDRKMMGQYKRDIMKLPPNMNKAPQYRDLTIHEILKLKPEKTIAIHTINKLLGRANTLFEYARLNGEIILNPAEGLNAKKTKRPDEERPIFTESDLTALFHSPQYLNDKFSRSYMFWTPILAAFTGARQEEVCALRLDDFEEHEGIWCINIVADKTEGKTIKNVASRRLVPLHPFLVDDLGIIRRVEHLRQLKKTRFMPDLNAVAGRYGKYVSRWFNERYKKQCGVSDDKVFHSFRHTFGTILSHNGMNDHTLKALMGHSEKSITFGTYVKRGAPQKLHKELVDHPDYKVDLDHLKGSKWTK